MKEIEILQQAATRLEAIKSPEALIFRQCIAVMLGAYYGGQLMKLSDVMFLAAQQFQSELLQQIVDTNAKQN